ncbi:MAG: YeeE/YedE family protein [Porticoccus sp.]|nr:YeeE/YedE family protein [Porticoccus sp.]
MSIADFSWPSALLGGALIGFAAVLMMITIGRIAGISSIFASTLKPSSTHSWQWAFIGGLLCSGLCVNWFYHPIQLDIQNNTFWLVVAGLLVGFGSRLGSGCTSGHGVCGIARFSPRSLVATTLFISSGMLAVAVLRQF